MDKWVKVQTVLDTVDGKDDGGKCVDADDFWKSTARAKKNLDRLVEKVVVEDQGLRVVFAAGVDFLIGG